MWGTETALIAGALWLKWGHPFPREQLICLLYFNPLIIHIDLDAEFLWLRRKFTTKYEKSLVLHATASLLYDTVYDQAVRGSTPVLTPRSGYHTSPPQLGT